MNLTSGPTAPKAWLWFQVAPGSAILQPLTVERRWDLFDLRQKVFRIACEKKGFSSPAGAAAAFPPK